MFRCLAFASVAFVSLAFLSADAQEVKKKAPATPVLTGKITDVNLDDAKKKVDSLFLEVKQGNRTFRRNVRVDEKTKIEFPETFKKDDQILKVGQTASVKLVAESDLAQTLKITTGVVPKKK